MVITSLPRPDTVEDVYLGDNGLRARATPVTIFLEMSTIDPDTTLVVAEAAEDRNIDLLGAPVSGGHEDCLPGTLTIMTGGTESVFRDPSVQDGLTTLGEQVCYTGGVDSDHTVKLVNNVMSMGNLLLAMGAVAFGSARDVDGEVLLDVLANAGGSSNQFEK